MTEKSLHVMKLSGCIGIALIVFSIPALAAKPSFDCAKADGEVEELICKDDDLAALDQTMAEVYKTALNKAPKDELNTLKAFQRGWVKGRDDCWKAEDMRNCVQSNYESRITDLQIAYGNQEVPAPVNFACEGGNGITAVFYQDTQLPAVVLTRIPDQVIAMLSPSASGAKYEGQNVTFWTKGNEAVVTWNGEEFTCQTQ